MTSSKGQRAPKAGLLLGWEKDSGQPICYNGDAPLLTVAPTGMGKGRGVLIPNTLLSNRALIQVDPKGEVAQVCAGLLQRLGQQVVILDPFLTVTRQSGGLNPLDLLELPGASVDGDAEMLTSLLSIGHESAKEPFWNHTSEALIGGLIAHVSSTQPAGQRHLGRVREWLYHDNMEMALATALDRREVTNRLARENIIAYLVAPEKETRPCIRASACTYFNALGSEQVARTLQRSTFNLRDVMEGRPLSVFIVIPPDKLESHRALLRLWVGTLLTAIMRRKHIPKQRTLFLIDECAQLGTLGAFRQAVTLLRGSGLQVWSFWQDLSQLRQLYPNDWQTIVNNAAALQVFGVNNHLMAKEWSEVLGLEPRQLLGIAPDEAMVQVYGRGCCVCRRPDYLHDEVFAGLYDPNPRFALHPEQPRHESPPRWNSMR